MRSVVMSIYVFMNALAAAIGEAFVCKSRLCHICADASCMQHMLTIFHVRSPLC